MLYGGRGSTQDNIFGDFAVFLGSLHGHTGGKGFGVAPPREHSTFILGKPEPEDSFWPLSESGGGVLAMV